MKKILVVLCCCVYVVQSFAQLSKGNWMVGGNISFTSVKYTADNASGETNTQFTFAPGAGFFFIDKFAAGARVSFSSYRSDGDKFRDLYVGPFARYYFLPIANKINLLTEANVLIGSEKYDGFEATSKFGFGFNAGPVFFINESIAIETLLGYRTLKHKSDPGRYNTFGVAIGFQLHLDGVMKNKARKTKLEK